jgi:hypothetical protein
MLVRGGRPARRWRSCDRGCPLGTGIDPWMWHANGTTGEERLGAGGEVEALRPPARSPLFAGASNRHHLPTGGAPGAALPPGSLRGTRPGPGRHSRFYAGSQETRRLPYPPLNGVRRLAREVGDLILVRVLPPGLFLQDCTCDLRERRTVGDRNEPLGFNGVWTKRGPSLGLRRASRSRPVGGCLQRSGPWRPGQQIGRAVQQRRSTLPVARRELYPGSRKSGIDPIRVVA